MSEPTLHLVVIGGTFGGVLLAITVLTALNDAIPPLLLTTGGLLLPLLITAVAVKAAGDHKSGG